MRLYVDTASLSEIEEWAQHPWVSGFTTNPTLMRAGAIQQADAYGGSAMDWAREAVRLAAGKPISIDGPPEVWDLGENVWRKTLPFPVGAYVQDERTNYTAICTVEQTRFTTGEENIVSVFAGRIMDTGRSAWSVIQAAKKTGAQVLWASVREPFNIKQAENYGCDIVTVPPAILRKWLEWRDKPLEVVAAETIEQFDRDREGLW